MAKANARRPPAAVEPLPPFEPWMSVRRRLWRGQWRCEICARKWSAGERVGRRKRADSAKYSCHIYSSCHLVIVRASRPGLRVLLLARVLVQVRVVLLVFLLVFVLFVDLVEPAPGPSRP